MALTISGTSNGKLGNLSLSASTGDILDSANTTFFGVDNWYLTANHTSDGTITSWARPSSMQYGRIGTGMSVSSGHWTFPSTGIYLMIGNFSLVATGTSNDNCAILGEVTTDNFSTTDADRQYCYHYDQSAWSAMVTFYGTFDCTDTSNDKIRIVASSLGSGNYVRGFDSNLNRTSLSFIRLGDT